MIPRQLVALPLAYFAYLPTLSDAASSHAPAQAGLAESTCVARTVNYITHGLPQQCLTSISAYSTATTSLGPTTPTNVSEKTATTTTSSGVDPGADAEDDDDGDLSTGSFMSFDEWKAMMVAKAENSEPKKRRVPEGRGEASNGDFASLGDEGEIDLDFDAYSDRISDFTTGPTKQGELEDKQENKLEKVTYEEGLAMVHRSKDAGKTCKERFSYSSFDAGATVIKTSKPIKNPSAILLENKDAYMLMECATENKFFIVELSDDILVDTVVLANYEFFSSMIREFRVSVSDRYPVKADKWKVLGTFQARNARDIQPFLVEHPQDWARYLRVEILNHWGNEFYCPVSLLRVHGTRMMEAFKEPEAIDDETEDEPPKPLAIEDAKAEEHGTILDEQVLEEPVEVVELEPEPTSEPSPPVATHEPVEPEHKEEMPFSEYVVDLDLLVPESTCPAAIDVVQVSGVRSRSNNHTYNNGSHPGLDTSDQITDDRSSDLTTRSLTSTTSAVHNSSATIPATSVADSSIRRITVRTMAHNHTTPRSSEHATTNSNTNGQPNPPRPTEPAEPVNNGPSHTSKSQISDPGSSKATNSQPQSAKSSTTTPSPTTRNKNSATGAAAAASPTVQDSFFKALTKRLQVLESNTTLSLQYIESQSKFVQEALAKLEKRQISRVDKFLNTLNNTVLNELRDMRREADQVWQSTVIALETQREQTQQEILALGSRVSVLADEVVFQKRMAIVQSILLLICLVLVIFSRGFQGGGAGMISADGSYSGQFFAASSRLGSPGYPVTPKSTYRDTPGRDRGNGLDVPRDSTPRPVNTRTGTPQEQYGQSSLRPPPTLSRSTSATAAELQEYYNQQLPTPGGSVHHDDAGEGEEELGYDSEPNMTPSRRSDFASKNVDYFFSAGNSVVDDGEQDARNSGPDGPGSGSGFGNAPERQHTPTNEVMSEEDYTPRQPTGRIGLMHTGSTRKPLPALPEDPD